MAIPTLRTPNLRLDKFYTDKRADRYSTGAGLAAITTPPDRLGKLLARNKASVQQRLSDRRRGR